LRASHGDGRAAFAAGSGVERRWRRRGLEPAPAGIDAADLLRRAAEALGARRTYLEAVLSVRQQDAVIGSEVRFRAWLERGSGRAFLRVLEPAGQAGMGLLRLPPNLWRYAPQTASLELLDPPRLEEPWLGSDFALADLLVGPTPLGSAPARLLGVAPASHGAESAFVLELARAARRTAACSPGSDGTHAPLRCDQHDHGAGRLLRFDELRGLRAAGCLWT
jgi:hypothetical protein